jgi:hypothetical protein
MQKWAIHSFDEIGASIDAIRAEQDAIARLARADLDDIFSSLRRIAGARGRFHVILQMDDYDQFRALGEHQKEIVIAPESRAIAMRIIELKGARLTAFCPLGKIVP